MATELQRVARGVRTPTLAGTMRDPLARYSDLGPPSTPTKLGVCAKLELGASGCVRPS